MGASFDASGDYVSGSALQYITLEYGGVEYGRFSYVVDAPRTTLYVDHSTIRDNGAGGVRSMGGYVTNNLVANNTLTATQDVTGTGVSNSGGGTIAYNTVTGNSVALNTPGSFACRGVGIANTGGGAVAHNTVSGNSSHNFSYSYGGGIYSTGGGTVSDNTVTANHGHSYSYGAWGGGIYSSDGWVSDNTVAENSALSSYDTALGGGIYSNRSTLSHNTVTSNTAYAQDAAYGGGIYHTGPYTLSNNTVVGNAAYYTDPASSDAARGGGIYSASGGVIANSEVRSNVVSGTRSYAGGVYVDGGSVCNNLIVSNTAQGNAAGLWWASGSGEVTYNTIAGNTALSNTGGIYVLNNYPTINHNAIHDNSGYALRNGAPSGDVHLDARYNWWGVTDTVALQGLIYDWFDDTSVSFVDYVPYLLDQPNKSPAGINASGRSAGFVNTPYAFEANVYPIATVRPLTFTWQATEGEIITHVVNSLYDTARFTWSSGAAGVKLITITAANEWGAATVTYTIDIALASSSDAYETDDACAQARAITTDGAAQLHTFHIISDTDWATFQAVADTTFIIEATTPDDSSADVSLEVYATCGGAPTFGQDNSFSPGVSLRFDASADGPIYLRLTNKAPSQSPPSEQGGGYYLSVRSLNQAATPGAVILVAGKRKDNDTLQPNIYNVTNAVYRLFLANGYTGDRIYYLAADTTLDADGDSKPDVDTASTKSSLQQAITQWAKDKVNADRPFTLYLMDHGDYDLFYLNHYSDGRLETVTPTELSNWLSELETAAPGVKVNVVFEACKSGSFIDHAQTISKPGRVVIASTGAHPLAWSSQTGGAAFSDPFIEALGRGMSLNSSFAEARWTLQQAHPDQTPWLDDNGNGIPNETSDGQEAARRGFAFRGTFDDMRWPPFIAQAVVKQSQGLVFAQVQAQSGRVISRTWALIYPPSYQSPPPGQDMAQDTVPQVELTDPDHDSLFTANYYFVETGAYRVVVYAVDDRGLSARPREASSGEFTGGLKIYLPLVLR